MLIYYLSSNIWCKWDISSHSFPYKKGTKMLYDSVCVCVCFGFSFVFFCMEEKCMTWRESLKPSTFILRPIFRLHGTPSPLPRGRSRVTEPDLNSPREGPKLGSCCTLASFWRFIHAVHPVGIHWTFVHAVHPVR